MVRLLIFHDLQKVSIKLRIEFVDFCRYFNRDVECIRTYFRKRYNYESMLYPKFQLDVNREFDLDVQVSASGFTKQHQQELETVINSKALSQ